MLNGKTIVVGVCGGIAAYKAADLVSRLKKMHANVRVCMTKAAQEFITPLTMQSLSQNTVATALFRTTENWDIEHISLAGAADVMLIVPATANTIAKLAAGLADDPVTTTALATKAKVVVAPAMNTNMYENPVTLENIERLRARGYVFIEPDSGRLACGVVGRGKLAPVEDILFEVVTQARYERDLEGVRVLVTAGPTREKIDDVRFITNHSSGKMGYALAQTAVRRGAAVRLVSGRVSLPPVPGVEMVYVDSAVQMHDAVMQDKDSFDIIIKAAAVGDFRVKNAASGKRKKDAFSVIELEENPDILQELGENKSYVLVGFCMETEDLELYAREKLLRKKPDFLVANDLSRDGAGFATDTNIVKILHQSGEVENLPIMSKTDLAGEILNRARLLLR